MTNFMNNHTPCDDKELHGWIPVSDLSRAPVLADDYDSHAVLVTDGRRVSGGHVAYKYGDPNEGLVWYAADDFCDEILYWMPAPSLPPITRGVLLRHTNPCLRYYECPLLTPGANCASYRFHGGGKCARFEYGFPEILDGVIKGADK